MGSAPTSFTAANQTFYVLGSATADRIAGTTWTVSGTTPKIVVGVPATAAIPASLRLEYNKAIVSTI